MNSNQLPVFDGAYLERYRRGELSPSEAHALEKAALEDPLLADALDGFRMANRDTTADLNLLRSQLDERIEANQAAIRQMPSTRFFSPLLRVAAILFLLIGAGWFSYIFWIGPRESELASNTAVPPPAAEPRIVTESTPVQAPVPQAAGPLQTSPSRKEVAPNTKTENTEPASKEPAPKQAEDLVVQAEQSKSMPESMPVVVGSTEGVVKDQVVVSVEATKKEFDEENNRQAVAFSQEAKEKSLKRSKSDKQITDNPEPVDGWAAYEEYLYGNRSRLDAAPTASNSVTRWQVLLSFEVDTKGRPAEIRVEESGGIYHDDAAKKLLREGPDWKPGKSGKRGQLRVHF